MTASLRYISTRGEAAGLSFEGAVLAGLAGDGGLYVPNHIPAFSTSEIAALQALSYAELAYAIMSRFVDDSVAPETLERLIAESYREFRHAAVAPLVQTGAHTFVLELFHGPTLAFKDFALQFLGRLLAHILAKRNQKAVVIGATSGDTGSAAIHGCRGHENLQICILHPKGRVSDVQRRQMTTVTDGNVHNLAVEGTFDDCQAIVKALLADKPFANQHGLIAVNSINWARILAQVVYYFYAALAIGAPAKSVSFAVPTGNFGDIYAGYVAKRMGLPVEQLIIAANRNNILSRCVGSGVYDVEHVIPTLSPSMDIQVASNFERMLFELYDHDGKAVTGLMAQLKEHKRFTLLPRALAKLQSEFASASVSDDEMLQTISDTYKATGYLLDPHTAVGLAAGSRCRSRTATPLIVLATAHPAKFPEAVKEAVGIRTPLPPFLHDLMLRKEKFETVANDAEVVRTYIEKYTA